MPAARTIAVLAPVLAGALALAAATAEAQPERKKGDLIVGKTVVIDGDLMAIGAYRVRLWGIDVPHGSDWCHREGRRWRSAREAASALRTCLQGKPVTCRVQKSERHWFRLRHVAECWTAEGQDLGECMVRAGWATDFTCFSDGHYRDLETEARNRRSGLWRCDNGPPTRRWGRLGFGELCEKPAYKPQGPGN